MSTYVIVDWFSRVNLSGTIYFSPLKHYPTNLHLGMKTKYLRKGNKKISSKSIDNMHFLRCFHKPYLQKIFFSISFFRELVWLLFATFSTEVRLCPCSDEATDAIVTLLSYFHFIRIQHMLWTCAVLTRYELTICRELSESSEICCFQNKHLKIIHYTLSYSELTVKVKKQIYITSSKLNFDNF